ncbi:hypothetical protein AK86_07755 [Streptococcus pneumoniae B1599]|nr:hypothetical protein AK86_07755 [Streptococcus pneumoniae B1599]
MRQAASPSRYQQIKISGNRTITASAKAGSGDGESKKNVPLTTTVVERQAPTVSEVTVAANGHTKCRTDQCGCLQLLRKLVRLPAEALKQVAAKAATQRFSYSLPIADGSTETASVGSYTLKQVTPSTVGFQQKRQRGCRLNPTNQCGQSDHHVYQPSWSTTDREIV